MSANGSGSGPTPAFSEKPGTSDTQLKEGVAPVSDLFQIPPEYEFLREKVTCHRCKGFQPGLVYVCSAFHIFCRHCHVTCRGVCPFVEDKRKVPCQSTLRPAKDHHHDAVFEASTFKCIYAKHGCTQKVAGTYYTLHMASCPFRPGPRDVPGNTSRVTAVYHVVKRVTSEYHEAQKKLASIITWSPELQKMQEEQHKQSKAPAICQSPYNN